jgi:hypothetical protein
MSLLPTKYTPIDSSVLGVASPASAYTGAAYDKCMAKCQKSGMTNRCPYWCESKH